MVTAEVWVLSVFLFVHFTFHWAAMFTSLQQLSARHQHWQRIHSLSLHVLFTITRLSSNTVLIKLIDYYLSIQNIWKYFLSEGFCYCTTFYEKTFSLKKMFSDVQYHWNISVTVQKLKRLLKLLWLKLESFVCLWLLMDHMAVCELHCNHSWLQLLSSTTTK